MRSSAKNVVGGFAAGLIVMLTLGSMMGLKQQGGAPAAIDPRLEALLNQSHEADDQLAASKTQVEFWKQEMATQDTEVVRLLTETQTDATVPFFSDRARCLSNRAANSYLDARLQAALCARKADALKSILAPK